MSSPSPFEVAQTISNKLGKLQTNISDRSAIDQILDKANKFENPEDLNAAITNIIRNVSPEKQAAVLGAAKQRFEQNQSQKALAKRKAALRSRGLSEDFAFFGDTVINQVLKGDMVKEKIGAERQEDADIEAEIQRARGVQEPAAEAVPAGPGVSTGVSTGVEGEEPLEEDQGVQLASGGQVSPRVQRQIAASVGETQGFDKKIDDLEKTITAIENAPNVSIKKKNELTKPKIRQQDNIRKAKDKFLEQNKQTEKRLIQISEEAVKARKGLNTVNEARELLDTTDVLPEEFSFANPLPFLQRIKRLAFKTPEETKLESLATDLLTQQFTTLPRIRNEFDAFVKANISLFNSAAGNRKILDRREDAFRLLLEADSLVSQLQDQGVQSNKIPRLVDRIMADEQDALMKKLKQDAKELRSGVGVSSADIDKILFGK